MLYPGGPPYQPGITDGREMPLRLGPCLATNIVEEAVTVVVLATKKRTVERTDESRLESRCSNYQYTVHSIHQIIIHMQSAGNVLYLHAYQYREFTKNNAIKIIQELSCALNNHCSRKSAMSAWISVYTIYHIHCHKNGK